MAAATVTGDVSTSQSDRPRVGAKSITLKPKLKAADGSALAEGEFTAYASVFGVKDLDCDVVQPGAFTKTLADWQSKGLPIPLLWGHVTTDPDMNIGEILDAKEDDHGLLIHARLDIETPKGAQTYRLIKGGRVNQLSYSYGIAKGEFIIPQGDTAEDPYFSLDEVDLYEISVVPIGANQDTEILAVKSVATSLASKAGRTLSMQNEEMLRGCLDQLDQASSAIKDVLGSLDNGGDSGGKAQDSTSGKEPPAVDAKSTAATPSPSVLLALTEIEIVEGEF